MTQQQDFGKPGDPNLFVADLHVYRLMGWGNLGPYLHGVHQCDRWAVDHQAECLKWPRDHDGVAHPDCECGIYGWYKPDRDFRTGSAIRHPFTVVRLSGRAILGSSGVRAERATILAVADEQARCTCGCEDDREPDTTFADAMAAYYPGVAVYPTRAALLEDYPPSNWESIVGPIEQPKNDATIHINFSISPSGVQQMRSSWQNVFQTLQTYTPPAYPQLLVYDDPIPATPVVADPLANVLGQVATAPTNAVLPESGNRPIRAGLPPHLTLYDTSRSTGPNTDPFRRGGRG